MNKRQKKYHVSKRNKKLTSIVGLMLLFVGLIVFGAISQYVGNIGGLVLAVAPVFAWIKEGKFEQLTDDEIKALKEEDLALYIKDFNNYKVTKAQAEIEAKLKNLVSKSDFDKLQESMKKINKAHQDDVTARIKEFEKLAEDTAKAINKNIQDADIKGLSNFEITLKTGKVKGSDSKIIDKLKNHKQGDRYSFSVKFSSADITGDPHGSQKVPGIGQIAGPKFVLSEFFSTSPIQIDNEGTASYDDWDEATTVASAAAIAEGATFPISVAKFKRYSIIIEKTGDSISMTVESMRDYRRFVAELTRFLTRNVKRAINSALWNGDGVTPNIAGIYTQTTLFNVLSVVAAEQTTVPNLIDLINVLSTRIEDGNDDKYQTNFIFISHQDKLAIKLLKDTTGNLLYPNGLEFVGNVQLVPTSFVVTNTAVIGDKDFVELIGDPNVIEIETGFKTGDFENDRESVKARTRTAMLIRNADLDGFLKVDDIGAALVAITKP